MEVYFTECIYPNIDRQLKRRWIIIIIVGNVNELSHIAVYIFQPQNFLLFTIHTCMHMMSVMMILHIPDPRHLDVH